MCVCIEERVQYVFSFKHEAVQATSSKIENEDVRPKFTTCTAVWLTKFTENMVKAEVTCRLCHVHDLEHLRGMLSENFICRQISCQRKISPVDLAYGTQRLKVEKHQNFIDDFSRETPEVSN